MEQTRPDTSFRHRNQSTPMKTLPPILALVGALCCFAPLLYAEAPSSFTPNAPEEGASALLETYLPLLAAGEFEQAILLNDMRGMRAYLLDRRLTELKKKNPELTARDLATMSAQIQLSDLNPVRLKEILRGVLEEGGYENMTWHIKGYAPAPESIDSYLVNVDIRTAAGEQKPLLLGIRKLGDNWMLAPAVVEELAAEKATAEILPQQPAPDPVRAIVNTFWSDWQQGELSEAYMLHGAAYRGRVPLLSYLQQTQEVIGRIGIPAAWTIAHCRAMAPDVLGLGVDVTGSKASMQTIMVFRKNGETWGLENSQYRPPPSAGAPVSPPVSGPDAGLHLRPNLHPDLKPSLAPVPASPGTPGAPALIQ